MGFRYFITIALFFSFLVVEAKKTKTQKLEDKTKSSMVEFLDHIMALQKYMVSDEEFQDPQNTDIISSHLKNLDEAVKKSAHDPILNQENFKFSREALEDHVHETERVFRLGNKSYARWMMNSTLGICMSCHTQVPTADRHFAVILKPSYFLNEFDRADFMFATKNFEGASQIYTSLVSKYPKSYLSANKIETSVQRELIYQIRVKRDLVAAKKSINKFLENSKLPEFLKKDLVSWREQLSHWINKGLPDVQKMSSDKLIQFIEQNLGRDSFDTSYPRYITNLVVSGILYEFLQKHPASTITPDILYWLAITDRELSHSSFYSLADMYLKECILKFPENSMAQKCYKEYETEMILGYTGSAGVNVPKEVLEDLKYLKGYIESKGKNSLKQRSP